MPPASKLVLPLALLTSLLAACGGESARYGIDPQRLVSDLSRDELTAVCTSTEEPSLIATPNASEALGQCVSQAASNGVGKACETAAKSCAEDGFSTSAHDPKTACERELLPLYVSGCGATWDELLRCFDARHEQLAADYASYAGITTCDAGAERAAKGLDASALPRPAACEAVRNKCPDLGLR